MRETSIDALEVVLLHSNDIHSRLELAAKMASYIEEERRRYGSDHVLTVDIGDHMDRMRVETEGSDGLVNIALLNASGYEVVTIGNNEGLTFTPEHLAEAYGERAKFQTICANFHYSSNGERPSWLAPYAIINKGPYRIGLIGATAAFAEFYKLLGWDVSDPLKAIAEQAAFLRDKVDVLIVMSHLGLPMDRRMAEEIKGLDLVLGGHTHHLLEEPELIGQTYLCAAGKFGDYIGRVVIGMDPITKRPTFRAECVPMAALEEQPEAAAIIGRFRAAGQRRLSRVIARLSAPLPAIAERESPLGNLLAAGLRRWTDAEIGIVNAGQLLGGLAAGDVTAGDIHALCPSPINPCRMRLRGRALRQALEESLLVEYKNKPIRGFGFRGIVLGTLAVDGIEIRWNEEAEPLNKITSILINGQSLEDECDYVVGTIDMFTFGVGYETIKSGTDVRYYLPGFIRDVLERELQESSALSDCQRIRWMASDTQSR
ncbi:bifunctional metallophosphatase/5'-nucleotidase [Paenibacillus baekrokdamisoli]|uniref:Bifunctional metallophosphatase/5'-nucleotidase n=1 Tax=Paenibacillus baekrokdamisoli TaxID=1712516 RepID=A0A3G9IZD4_9BACL|nr:bifunctional UDP-sugar hydrolase/5'-nucleotidase [Paenibacillus baekrokdamisoli]MBB3071097.1 2',3'-cyclic-nucleotide 2'-phosphodiesterase (5'-nucleotidase family) [Paenibacillus baekrokdamisoli]BBH21515.1 bifunctional metallophosphatase/5'-nucleotidase [Paenibacillus baekrokdamisoli]